MATRVSLSKSLIQASINHPSLRNIILLNANSYYYISKLKGTDVLDLKLTPCCSNSLPYLTGLVLLVVRSSRESTSSTCWPVYFFKHVTPSLNNLPLWLR